MMGWKEWRETTVGLLLSQHLPLISQQHQLFLVYLPSWKTSESPMREQPAEHVYCNYHVISKHCIVLGLTVPYSVFSPLV